MKSIENVGLGVADVEPDSDALGEGVEDREGRRWVDLRPAVGGDEQRATAEVDLRVRLGDQPGEPGAIGGS